MFARPIGGMRGAAADGGCEDELPRLGLLLGEQADLDEVQRTDEAVADAETAGARAAVGAGREHGSAAMRAANCGVAALRRVSGPTGASLGRRGGHRADRRGRRGDRIAGHDRV